MASEESANPAYSLVLPKWVRHSNRPICSVDIHPDGEIFATAGWDNYVKIWSFPGLSDPTNTKSKLVALLREHTGSVNCVRFSPDGKFLASCSDDSMVFLWQRVRCFGPPSTFGIPDSALQPNKPIQRWSGRRFSGNSGDVNGIAWSPDSQRIVSCSLDGHLIAWDVKSGATLWRFVEQVPAPVGFLSITWDPLNKFVIGQTLDGRLFVINTNGDSFKPPISEVSVNSEQAMVSRMSWTPDGAYIGVCGHKEKCCGMFFQRESFNFAFGLEGHIGPLTCVACAPFVLKDGDNYCTLAATVDKTGVFALWLIGTNPRPLFVLDRISGSTSNDVVFSHDGKWILIALESDPVTREGGLLCVRLLNKLDYPMADPSELADLQARLLGQGTFRARPNSGVKKSDVLPTFDIKEKEVDLEILQLTTEEVIERQVETVINGSRIIRPVLLTAREKQGIALLCSLDAPVGPRIPHELSRSDMTWAKPASLSGQPTKQVLLDDCVIVAYDVYVTKLARESGRRISPPFVIDAKCRHLSVGDGVLLAVGARCFVLDLADMKLIFSFDCPDQFYDFTIASRDVIVGHGRGKGWIYDVSAGAWIGGVLTQSPVDASMEEVERFASWDPYEGAAAQWFDFGMSVMFAAYSGELEQKQSFLEQMQEHCEGDAAGNYLERVQAPLEARWGTDAPQADT
jgi:protein HIRA/HIR1